MPHPTTILPTNPFPGIGAPFIELESVDSTNNYAMAQVHAGKASHGALFFAHEQWAGKGQRGKTWASAPGENLIVSVVVEPVFLPIPQSFLLSMVIALSAYDLFSRYAGPDDCSIKWPNDLYWRDRKAGGILIENSFRGDQWLAAIAGIGMNINQVQFPEALRKAVSLRQITGRSFNAVELARELAECMEQRYRQLRAEWETAKKEQPSGADPLLQAYNARLYKRGEAVHLKKDGEVLERRVREVSAAGELVTGRAETGILKKPGEQADTEEQRFRFGEVEWVIGE